ncbi:MAG: hypothetical protein K0R07_474 [Sedimentibacter sp.]|jgi:hypothetical protein|nr:hypothetical protein [Sedimentibacter sp.]
MGKMNKKHYSLVLCFITGLLWGVIFGAVSISTLVSVRMDMFYQKIAYLENVITDKEEKLSKLEKSINNRNTVLKDVQVILEFINLSEEQISQINNIEIEKSIKEKFSSSLGKEVKGFDVEILQQVIDKRILKLDGYEYQLTVNKLVLTDILKLWIKVTLIEVES